MADSQKRPGRSRGAARDESFEAEVIRVIRALGWGIPETDAEVIQAEAERTREPVEIPAVLRDASVILKRTQSNAVQQPPGFAVNPDITASLARAAREGGEIAPETEAQMRQDLERVENWDEGK